MSFATILTIRNSAIAVASIALAGSVTMLAKQGNDAAAQESRFALGGKVKRLSGDHIKLRDGRSVEFAAIRLPYEDEPHSEPAKRTLTKWIEGEGVRLQFDEFRDHKNGRILAYIYANDTFINERLVRGGLAFVKLRSGNRRSAESLLAAQAAAREERVGIWSEIVPTSAGDYLGDEAAATFHRPGCPDAREKTGLVRLVGTTAAFDRGLAPCGKCHPLANAGN